MADPRAVNRTMLRWKTDIAPLGKPKTHLSDFQRKTSKNSFFACLCCAIDRIGLERIKSCFFLTHRKVLVVQKWQVFFVTIRYWFPIVQTTVHAIFLVFTATIQVEIWQALCQVVVLILWCSVRRDMTYHKPSNFVVFRKLFAIDLYVLWWSAAWLGWRVDELSPVVPNAVRVGEESGDSSTPWHRFRSDYSEKVSVAHVFCFTRHQAWWTMLSDTPW